MARHDEDIGRLQHRIGKKSVIRRNSLLNLILVCMAPFEQAHGRDGRQDPLKLAYFRQIALHIDGAPFRIQSQGKIVRGRAARQFQQSPPITHRGERMVVRQEVIALVAAFSELDELLHCSEVIAKMQIARRLDPGNNDHFFRSVRHSYLSP